MSAPTNDPFTKRALKIYDDAKNQIGYVAHRFRQKIVRDGGLAAAKHWLRPSKATSGFQRLLDHDRLDLSVEAVALQPPWNTLFTSAELDTARERLTRFGYFSRPTTPPTESSQLSPDELPDKFQFPEGAKSQITVSAYERNSEARKKCIEHYSSSCYVCGFDFAKVYGELGSGFIHVHHLTPFAVLGEPRLTDPVADLRPVCPNCHAMLHRRYPPIPIAELKRIVGNSITNSQLPGRRRA
ncbi:MAG TPA: HNH endonuclease [Verrucomicrobiae bacterium]|nr:HNH endonuclease [Verrucomicrobiae bacterium]